MLKNVLKEKIIFNLVQINYTKDCFNHTRFGSQRKCKQTQKKLYR